MAIPTGYEKLTVIGIAYKGDYADGTVYKLLSAVYYNGATYVALKDDPVTPPAADGVNWQYLAKGFTDGVLSAIEATDTSGLMGAAGATVGAQALLDVIADKVADKLLAKNQVVNNLLATEPGNVLDACQGKALKDLIDQQNSDLIVKGLQITTNTDILLNTSVYRYGKLVIVNIIANFTNATANTLNDVITGLPNAVNPVGISVPNEYGSAGVATFKITGNKLTAKCTQSNSFYYCTMEYFTNE